MIRLFFLLALFTSSNLAFGQESDAPMGSEKKEEKKEKKDPYKELLKGAEVQLGLFDVISKDGKLLFELPNKLLGEEILVVSRIKGFVKGLSYASLPSDIFINAKVNGSDPVDGFFRHYAELDKVRHNFELGLSLFQPNENFYLDLDYSTDLNPQFNNRSAAVSVGFRF